jgi:hypothetical protein
LIRKGFGKSDCTRQEEDAEEAGARCEISVLIISGESGMEFEEELITEP